MSVLIDIFTHRQKSLGFNSNRFIELVNGKEVPIQFYEPDPNTFRSDYYYNARLNVLYKKVMNSSACPPPVFPGTIPPLPVFYWQPLLDTCSYD